MALVASVCVDYLSYPLSAHDLVVSYQQITRQIAHAPVSAKEAATTFQGQSSARVELLGHSQSSALALALDKERPAPVGCKAHLRRMQNTLWRRSSQQVLAKDVPLIAPESLNWQKECDVLWLYGPLYAASQGDDYDLASTVSSTSTTTSTPAESVQFGSDCDTESMVESTPEDDSDTIVPSSPVDRSIKTFESTMVMAQQVDQALTAAVCALAISAGPKKSSLKQLQSRHQIAQDLKAFTRTRSYLLLTQLSTADNVSNSESEEVVLGRPPVATRSLPSIHLGNNSNNNNSKYHFRSSDRRRATLPNCSATLTPSQTSATNKNLRFCLEVQELEYLPTLPPLRISKAGPVRANSDPSLFQSMAASVARQAATAHTEMILASAKLHDPTLSSSNSDIYTSGPPMVLFHGSRSLKSSGAASSSTSRAMELYEGRAIGSSSSGSNDGAPYLPSATDLDFNYDFNDDYLFDQDDEHYESMVHHKRSKPSTISSCGHDFDEDDDDINFEPKLIPAKMDTIVVRRLERHPNDNESTGVLWRVYTAVTGVRDIVAWCGSMVFYSSPL